MSRIHYITYQNFPAETGNSLQSISNIIEMVRMGNDVTLTFPNRAKDSTKEISVLQEYYNFSENFKVNRVSHPLPFGKFNFLLKKSQQVSIRNVMRKLEVLNQRKKTCQILFHN